MIPYFFLIGVPIYLSFFMIKTGSLTIKPDKHKYLIWAFFAIYILLLCLRHESVGIDLESYLPTFQEVAKTSWEKLTTSFTMESGYIVLNKIIATVTENEQIFLVILALISTLPIAWMYAKESENAILAIALFMILPNFSMIFSGLRQAIAMAMCVPAYYCTKKKKLFLFVLVIAFAILFHKSAFVMAIIYPLYHMNLTRKKVFLLLPMILAVFIFRNRVFSILIRFMGDEYEERYGEISNTGAFAMLLLFIAFAVLAYVFASERYIDRDFIGLRNILLLSVVLQFFASVNAIAMRMNYYFIIFIPLLVPKIMKRAPEEERDIHRAVQVVISAFLIFYFFLRAYTDTDILQIFPYKFFWE